MKTIIIDGVEYNLTPKVAFREGDWVVNTFTHYVEQIIGITNNVYICSECSIVSFENQHLLKKWTIQDAKDGDVIYVSTEAKGIQAIFHKFENGIIYFHCYLCRDFMQGGYMPIGSVELVYPLQKTHYNKFFEKMHEAGYEWDAEKKELKKIEQSPSWSEEDETALCDALWCCKQAASIAKDENDMGNVWYAERWLKSLKDRFGCEVNCTTTKAWSEEDECVISLILSICNDFLESFKISPASTKVVQNDIDKIDSWLKSLKERYTWKPSDEQMKVLSKYAEQNNYDRSVLTSLYQELKKLKE